MAELPIGGGYWEQELGLAPPSNDPSQYQDDPYQGYNPGGQRPKPEVPATVDTNTGGPVGGGGGAAGGTTAAPPVPDWEQALIAIGMPPELIKQIADYYAGHADDPDIQQKLLALVRGSDWWKQTFPGFWQGYGRGLFSDETGYRQWLAGANDAWHRYYGRDLTSDEIAGYMTQGFNPSTLEQIGAGHAYAEANRGDLQWATGAFDTALTDAEREAYGQEVAGRDTDLGARIKARVDKAVATAQRVFQGQVSSPNLQLGSAGLSAPSLNPRPKPDVGA